MRQRNDRDQTESQEYPTEDSCFGLVGPHQSSIAPKRKDCAVNVSQMLQILECSLVVHGNDTRYGLFCGNEVCRRLLNRNCS